MTVRSSGIKPVQKPILPGDMTMKHVAERIPKARKRGGPDARALVLCWDELQRVNQGQPTTESKVQLYEALSDYKDRNEKLVVQVRELSDLNKTLEDKLNSLRRKYNRVKKELAVGLYGSAAPSEDDEPDTLNGE